MNNRKSVKKALELFFFGIGIDVLKSCFKIRIDGRLKKGKECCDERTLRISKHIERLAASWQRAEKEFICNKTEND